VDTEEQRRQMSVNQYCKEHGITHEQYYEMKERQSQKTEWREYDYAHTEFSNRKQRRKNAALSRRNHTQEQVNGR